MIEIENFTSRSLLRLCIVPMGKDLCVCLGGGDAPHIGAVALAVPRPSLHADGGMSASVSVLTVTGHKEDVLARDIAHALASAAACTVCVSCGIHLDDADEHEIGDILRVVDDMVADAIRAIRQTQARPKIAAAF